MAGSFVNFLINIIFLVNIFYIDANDEFPEVISSLGTIRGLRANNGHYSMFYGIPYARVNESNPFGASLPVREFDGVFEAFNADISCPHTEEFNMTTIGILDCLTLNIYVPDSASPENPVPILFYIFGGSFVLGSADDFLLGPKFLMRHDVMLIKINYRLGPYGFFCLNTPEIPGNQGLRDQYTAMKWVQENIAAFGGDPNKVTIFGNSAGAMSVDYHVLSEAELLFNGAIMQSGSAFATPLTGAKPTEPLVIAEALGLNTKNLNEALDFIMSFDPITVIQATEAIGVTTAPCIEEEFEGIQRMISGNSVNLKAPKSKGIKVMVGSNDDELLYVLAQIPPELYPFVVELIFGDSLADMFELDDDALKTATRAVRNFYIGDEDFTSAVLFDLGDLFSDGGFIYPTERTIRQYLDSGAEIYYYIFTYSGGRNFMQIQSNTNLRGAYHADELGYLFDIGLVTVEPTPEDQLIIDRMTTMWTNFAKYGNPTPEATELLPVKWQPITKGSVYHYMNITTDMNAGRRPFSKRMVFWDLFYEAYGRYERTLLKADDKPIDNVNNNAFNVFPCVLLIISLGTVSRMIV